MPPAWGISELTFESTGCHVDWGRRAVRVSMKSGSCAPCQCASLFVWAAVRDGCLSCEPPCLLRCACRMLGFCCKLSRLCAHLGSGGRPLENCPQEGCPSWVPDLLPQVLAWTAVPPVLLWFGLIWYFFFRSAPHSLCSLPPRNSLNSLSHCCED